MFRAYVLIIRRSKLHYTASVIITSIGEMFSKNDTFYGEETLPPRPTPNLEDHHLSAVRDCLFNIFAATLRVRRQFLHPPPEDAPCRCDKESLNTVYNHYHQGNARQQSVAVIPTVRLAWPVLCPRYINKHQAWRNDNVTTWFPLCCCCSQMLTQTPNLLH